MTAWYIVNGTWSFCKNYCKNWWNVKQLSPKENFTHFRQWPTCLQNSRPYLAGAAPLHQQLSVVNASNLWKKGNQIYLLFHLFPCNLNSLLLSIFSPHYYFPELFPVFPNALTTYTFFLSHCLALSPFPPKPSPALSRLILLWVSVTQNWQHREDPLPHGSPRLQLSSGQVETPVPQLR